MKLNKTEGVLFSKAAQQEAVQRSLKSSVVQKNNNIQIPLLWF